MDRILTVSIAAYNAEQYIENTLRSLICSNMDKLEVLIIDDGSTDRTLSIAREFESRYPDTFRAIHKENGGYGSTINTSISEAGGKYFKLLDADDWFLTENLDRFIDYLEGTESDIVISPYYDVKGSDVRYRLIDSHPQVKPAMEEIDEIRLSERLMMHELSVRTSILQENNVSITENCFYTDNEFAFLSVLLSRTISRFDGPIYCYRTGLNGQSVSIKGILLHYRDIKKVAFRLYDLFMDHLNSSDHRDKGKQDILKMRIRLVTVCVYSYYLATGDKEIYYDELKDTDREIRSRYPLIYKITDYSKRIILLRRSFFLLAPIISRRVRREIEDR